ncbi:helix-turn-helix domain-containing protein, partial [Myxococcota bacterium]|nr:helix-turn-helix domain-containing protein [Myxococcota bacterium]
MAQRTEPEWTIEALGEAVRAALSVGYEGQVNGQVRDVPDRRTIRYYTTLGLLDRPVMRGRTAIYGRRHLLQLVAIKRLQAEGLALADVQARLTGLGLAALKKLAALPDELAPERLASKTEETGRRLDAFWGELPADEPGDGRRADEWGRVEDAPRRRAPAARARVAVELGDELVLL